MAESTTTFSRDEALALLQWHIDAGVDETLVDEPQNWFLAKPPPVPMAEAVADALPRPAPMGPSAMPKSSGALTAPSVATAKTREIADGCADLASLEQAVRNFDGLAITKTATNTVFADGVADARVMVIGEAPGASEDAQGIPFCGVSGQLLDRMLAAIGLTRKKNVYITNTLFWRPPGNRQPGKEELAICQPFVEKHIALINPALIILAGGTATSAVLNNATSVSRLRGKLYDYTNAYLDRTIPVAVTYHPSYLLRSPQQKRLAWNDLIFIQKTLAGLGITTVSN